MAKPAGEKTEVLDGYFDVLINPDRMFAYLTLIPPSGGGIPITHDAIREKLAALKIKSDKIDHRAIEAALKAGKADSLKIASGRPVEQGESAQFISLVEEAGDRRPKVSEDGSIDFRDMGEIFAVKVGDLLMRRIPAKPGKNGETLLGAAMIANKGKDANFAQRLKGVEPCPDDPNVLRATIAGQPVVVDRGVYVDPVFTVKNVTIATGNIIFDGAVTISGDVASGMMVQTTGDMVIEGTVENAILESEGDITIKSGLIASPDISKKTKDMPPPYVKCKGSLTARFAQGVKAEAGAGIYIEDSALQCDFVAGKEITVGRKGKGIISNGTYRATYSVRAKILGASNGAKTQIRVGADPTLKEDYQKACIDLAAWEKRFSAMNAVIENKDNPASSEILAKARPALAKILALMDLARQKRDCLKAELEALAGANIVALEKVYPGVELLIDTQKSQIGSEKDKSTFALEEGKIAIVNAKGK